MQTDNLARNLTMLTDFYEMTMANGYLAQGMGDHIAVFDLFFRAVPDDGGFAIFAGLEQVIHYLENLCFTDDDIDYLRGRGLFCEEFLRFLKRFRFSCDVYAMREGTPIFPGEPIAVVRGPVIEAQLIETMLLLTINHQSLIATKTGRIVRAAEGRTVLEFGARRAQSYDAAVLGARAAYIGGADGTSCTLADVTYEVPAGGTMAHSWIQMFPTEYEAFRAYAEVYPANCSLLVDTYSVIRSGIPNAIRAFREVVLPRGHRPHSVRIDSGDIAYLSKKARAMLDEAGFSDVKIIASNSLDEYIIRDLLLQGAAVDIFGVGENLITSRSSPVFSGVYKLVAVKENGAYAGRIKLSETPEKITTPGFKKMWRLYSAETGKAQADYLSFFDEQLPPHIDEIEIFDPHAVWKRKTLTDVVAREMLVPVFQGGRLVYDCPSIGEIRAFRAAEVEALWDEVKRFEFPHRYYVDYSQKLYDEKQRLLIAAGAAQ